MKLADWLVKNDVKRSAFAEQTGLTPSAITQLCNGDFEPRLRTLVAIEEATGGEVTMHDMVKDVPEAAQ